MSVNEGLTTDTAMTTDMEGNAETAAATSGAAGSESTDQEEAEGGIVSSEDEAVVPGSSNSNAKSPLFNKGEMFSDEKSKDIQEHAFNFGDQDVEKFE